MSAISWTDHSFAPWFGCAKVSPACDHCYAEAWTLCFRKAGVGTARRARTVGRFDLARAARLEPPGRARGRAAVPVLLRAERRLRQPGAG